MELTEDEKRDFGVVKEKLIRKLAPLEFVSLEQFQKRAIFPGESIGMYLYELKRLLRQAMPELAEDASQQLLIHQFLAGLPAPVSRLVSRCQTAFFRFSLWWRKKGSGLVRSSISS